MDEKAAEYLERAVEILPYDYQSGIISALSTGDWNNP